LTVSLPYGRKRALGHSLRWRWAGLMLDGRGMV
jgi:hypothetical protein